jgi:hypothetical protein
MVPAAHCRVLYQHVVVQLVNSLWLRALAPLTPSLTSALFPRSQFALLLRARSPIMRAQDADASDRDRALGAERNRLLQDECTPYMLRRCVVCCAGGLAMLQACLGFRAQGF